MNISWNLISTVMCLFSIESSFAELKLIQAVFRHGNRAPTDPADYYPMDPHGNDTFLPEGKGGLTNIGKVSCFKLGKFYRERYGMFLGPVFKSDIIHFRADEQERIVMSGQTVAAAMFPPPPSQRWNPDLDWQPIPIWTKPIEKDLLYNGLFCSNSNKWRVEVETHDPDVLKYKELNKENLRYLFEHTGVNYTIFKTFFLRQLFYSEMDVGLELPKWTKSVFPNGSLDNLAAFSLKIMSGNNEMKQLLGGIWIGEFLNHVNDYVNKTEGISKAYMYAAHEINIAPILIALNNYDNHVPSYCSTVVFELHEVNNALYVQVIHKDQVDQDKFRILEVPGCHQKMCPLNVFRELVKDLIPENPQKLCGDFTGNVS